MYHKLGRPRRAVKAQSILIKEDGCDPVIYKFDNRGNLIDNETKSSNAKLEIEKSKTDIQEEKQDSILETKCDDLSDINYYLNKKPFPNLADIYTDIMFPNIIQPLLVI